MCVVCDGGKLEGLEKLECCRGVAAIPIIPGLKRLICRKALRLEEIPAIASLRDIDCNGCANLTRLPDEKICQNIVMLICGQTKITAIPSYQSLKTLGCAKCPGITEIPMLQTLTRLDCRECPIKSMPVLPKLRWLACGDNPFTTLPVLPALKHLLIRDNTFTEVPRLPELISLSCMSCHNLLSIMPQPRLQYFRRRLCRFLYVPRGMRHLPVRLSFMVGLASEGSNTLGSRIRAWAWRGKLRLLKRMELTRVLLDLRQPAFTRDVIEIVAAIM